MFAKSFASFALLGSLCAPYAAGGIVSLYIPNNVAGDGLPLTADPIGTDNTGHTTWRLGVGASSGTYTDLQFAQTSVVATLVEGPTDVQVFANVGGATSAHESCAIATPTASGAAPIASCVLEIADGSTTGTIAGTETATPMPIQVADSKTSGSSSSGKQTASTSITSGSGSAVPTQTGKGNGAGRMSEMGVGALGVLGVMNVLLAVVL
ncbi:hypothetical protein GSI_11821 [Ganoderma sinense ZZ0214-1]|uniref:Uncharacterized protein n=1 Tax=Ganoderma sinense ZZ0214-1 TaxID=1077348 RepID=A0A2G8RX50_9APHY|nr:hypothetical protein GSI_11821 [Ganoderma sinense ZZ0214-1]